MEDRNERKDGSEEIQENLSRKTTGKDTGTGKSKVKTGRDEIKNTRIT